LSTTTRLTSIIGFAITGVVALSGSTGCMSEFQVNRATLTEKGTLKITDPEPVPLPKRAPNNIPVYWKDRERRETTGESMPKRPYDVIGRVHAVVGYAWQTNVLLDVQFRRAAAAIGGDAVLDVHKGTYNPKDPSNEYTGYVIKWKTPAATTP
jgi:hypothetical protein